MTACKVNNAVILAAGLSSRFVPLCFDMPKGLIPIRGETLIERQIRQLHEVDIKDVTIITGAHREQFEFLKEKYGVRLIYNADFATKNNFSSLYAAREFLSNTIISSSDLYFSRNIFQERSDYSYYASIFVKGKTKHRSLELDINDTIINTKYGGSDTWVTFGGHAFFTEELSKKIIDYIHPVYHRAEYRDKYWVDFQDMHLAALPMRIKRLQQGDMLEFNTLEALWRFDDAFHAVNVSATMRSICISLGLTDERQIKNFQPIYNNNFIIGCSLYYMQQRYEYLISNGTLDGDRNDQRNRNDL